MLPPDVIGLYVLVPAGSLSHGRAHTANPHAALAFDALTVEGALIAPAMLARIAAAAGRRTDGSRLRHPQGPDPARRDRALFPHRPGPVYRVSASADAIARGDDALRRGAPARRVRLCRHSRVGTRKLGERSLSRHTGALGGRVPVVVGPAIRTNSIAPSTHLAERWPPAFRRLRRQDWLNASDGALWGLCSNGDHAAPVARQRQPDAACLYRGRSAPHLRGRGIRRFRRLWLLIHASRFGRAGTRRPTARWSAGARPGQTEGVAARDRLRDGVEAALLSLGNGFLSHPDNAALRERVAERRAAATGIFRPAAAAGLSADLSARGRGPQPAASAAAPRRPRASSTPKVIRSARLRDRAVRRAAWDRHHDRWEGLLITFAALARGEPTLGLPALGGLVRAGDDPGSGERAARQPRPDGGDLPSRLAERRSGLVPVNWRDMETEELGSVYESLLELTPRLTDDGRGFAFAEGGEAKGHARKTTGSYYTPDSLVQALLDSALDPVLDRVEAEADDPAAALLSVTVIDPACGSGHFLLAAARRIATRVARTRAGGVASAEDYPPRAARCGARLHPRRRPQSDGGRADQGGALDRDGRAGQAARLPRRAISAAAIRCSGCSTSRRCEQGIPDAAYKPLTGDDKETAKYFERRNKDEREGQGSLDFADGGGRLPAAAPLAGEARALRAMPEDSPEEIAAKRKRFEAGRADPRRWSLRIAADLYIAAFLTPKTGGVPANRNAVTIPTTAHVWDALAGRTVYGPLVGRAQELAGAARAFHWPLEFPDVMAAGGFDVVLGNPPWERIKLQEQEFFAAREPEIAKAPNAAARGRLIAKLKAAAPGTRGRALYEEFETAKRAAEAASSFRACRGEEGGRFPLTGRGDVNTYALFAELFANLAARAVVQA